MAGDAVVAALTDGGGEAARVVPGQDTGAARVAAARSRDNEGPPVMPLRRLGAPSAGRAKKAPFLRPIDAINKVGSTVVVPQKSLLVAVRGPTVAPTPPGVRRPSAAAHAHVVTGRVPRVVGAGAVPACRGDAVPVATAMAVATAPRLPCGAAGMVVAPSRLLRRGP